MHDQYSMTCLGQLLISQVNFKDYLFVKRANAILVQTCIKLFET